MSTTREELIPYLTDCEEVSHSNGNWDRNHESPYWQSQYGLSDNQVVELENICDDIENMFEAEKLSLEDYSGCSEELGKLCEIYSELFKKYTA